MPPSAASQVFDLAVAALAASSVIVAIVTVAWPHLARDNLADRMRRIGDERARLRELQRVRHEETSGKTALVAAPNRFYREIVVRFRLSARAEDSRTRLRLRQAGYYNPAALVSFLAAQVLTPFAFTAATALYLFVLLDTALSTQIKLAALPVAAVLGYFGPVIFLSNQITKRREAILRAWPDALDLLLICVESGMSMDVALKRVSEEIGAQSPELAEELSLTVAELAYLNDRRQALENLGSRTGLYSVRAVVASLLQSEKHGTSLGMSLRVLAQESRDMRMMAAEKKAASLPPKLTVPMILFFLPALFVVILAPAIIKLMQQMG
ncbi:MAG: type II secretion system F family protein [Rhodobacteraceae bacterium]|nr:MAG: type II secretion system F family protein [Paracoccaceae bacterium]